MLAATDGMVPTRGRGPDDPWFLHRSWTNESFRIQDAPQHIQEGVAKEIRGFDLRAKLLQRCDDVQGLGHVPPMDASDSTRVLSEAIEQHADEREAVAVAVMAAKSKGFADSTIAFALSSLEDAATLSDALDGVEVVSVSQLADEMRARPG